MDRSVEIMRKAIDLGVNYFDTAYVYNNGQSEIAVGRAVKGRREDVYLSTKIPVHAYPNETHRWLELVEEQLERLDTDYIDFWNFHFAPPNVSSAVSARVSVRRT